MYGTADRPIHQVQVEKNRAVITSRSNMFSSAKDNSSSDSVVQRTPGKENAI